MRLVKGFGMRAVVAIFLICGGILMTNIAWSQDLRNSQQHAQTTRMNRLDPSHTCAQVISCGAKNGVRREYPSPCAAKDDGAIDIAPKNGTTCEASK